jgi:succinate dehydrogenase/fumarate reductase flavoprotein subunit
MYILIRTTMGGIRVDTRCRVLNADGQPVPGLFAAGEATGFGQVNGQNGLEGTFLGAAILMGRVAAQTVAAAVKSKPAPRPTAALPLTSPAANPKLGATCNGCHNVPELLQTKRDGYWHFENVHKLALRTKRYCTGCHVNTQPFGARRPVVAE